MSWAISLNGHLDGEKSNGPEEVENVKKLAKAITALAKDAGVGLTYVSASIPNEGQQTFFHSGMNLDVTEETAVEDEEDPEEDE